jgi:hypothetical protein
MTITLIVTIISAIGGLLVYFFKGSATPSGSAAQDAVDQQRAMDQAAINPPTKADAEKRLRDGDV